MHGVEASAIKAGGSQELLRSAQLCFHFSHIDLIFCLQNAQSLVVSDCFTAAVAQNAPPPVPSSPLLELNSERKIIFMRVRGLGIKGWIIFRKRRTSSLR